MQPNIYKSQKSCKMLDSYSRNPLCRLGRSSFTGATDHYVVAIEAPMIKTLQAVSRSLCSESMARAGGAAGDRESCYDSTHAMKWEIFGA